MSCPDFLIDLQDESVEIKREVVHAIAEYVRKTNTPPVLAPVHPELGAIYFNHCVEYGVYYGMSQQCSDDLWNSTARSLPRITAQQFLGCFNTEAEDLRNPE